MPVFYEFRHKIRKNIKKGGVLNLELAGIYECVLLLEKDEDKRKKILEKIMTENFPYLAKDKNLEIQESQRSPNGKNTKNP